MNKLTIIKLSILAILIAGTIGFLIYMTTHAGSWTDRNEMSLYCEKQGFSYPEYVELYKDCIEISEIINDELGHQNNEAVADHIRCFLKYHVNTPAARQLLKDLEECNFQLE